MKYINVDYYNKLKGVYIVETIDITDHSYILSEQIPVLKKYLNLICPYVNLDKISHGGYTNYFSSRLEKLIVDEIAWINSQEKEIVAEFSISVRDDRYVKRKTYVIE